LDMLGKSGRKSNGDFLFKNKALPQANKKFFGAAVFQKCCRGVGEQPTFAEQIETAQYEMQQKSKRELEESQLPLKIKRL